MELICYAHLTSPVTHIICCSHLTSPSAFQAEVGAALAAARSASVSAREALIQEAEGVHALLQEQMGLMERERVEAVAEMRSCKQAAGCLEELGGPEGVVRMQHELEVARSTATALDCKLQSTESARYAP